MMNSNKLYLIKKKKKKFLFSYIYNISIHYYFSSIRNIWKIRLSVKSLNTNHKIKLLRE